MRSLMDLIGEPEIATIDDICKDGLGSSIDFL
jgi:hypothetical protein